MPRFYFLVLLLILLAPLSAFSQDSLWTLEGSIQYALQHNIDIRQSVLNERLAALQLKQSRFSQIPSVSGSADFGRSFGRSIDPTSNQFINAGYNFAGINANANVLLFGWFQKKNTISRDKFSLQAANADLDQLRDDVSLNVATGFLRILLANEQVRIAENQVNLSQKQRLQTKAFVEAGSKPELDLTQLEAQVATDSATYFTALTEYNQAVLDMKALLNLDIAEPYIAAAPQIDNFSYEEIITQKPDEIYEQAKGHLGSVKSSILKEEAARKGLAASKGALYPQLSLGAQAGTNYSSALKEITDFTVVGAQPNGSFINVNGTDYPVYEPTIHYGQITTPFGKQLNNNFRQTVALSVTIPVFNGWVARNAVEQGKIDVQSKGLELERTKVKLKQDVYKAWYDARTAIQKYYAASRAAEASEKATTIASQRYELGLMNAVELLTTQNTGFKAKADALSAKYDLVFKLKVIDYYLGKAIKL